MACHFNADQLMVPMPVWVVARQWDTIPPSVRYYGGSLIGWVRGWRHAWMFISQQAAKEQRDALGIGVAVRIVMLPDGDTSVV